MKRVLFSFIVAIYKFIENEEGERQITTNTYGYTGAH